MKLIKKKYKLWAYNNYRHKFITDNKDRLLYYWDLDSQPNAWKHSTWGPDKTIYDLPVQYAKEEYYIIEKLSKKEVFIEIL